MAELFKFRCPACGKLLGAPARKAGKVIHCPQCSAELVVPDPEEASSADPDRDDEAVDLADLGINLGIDLGFAASPGARPAEAPPARPAQEAEAISFLERAVAAAPIEPATAPRADDINQPTPDSSAGPMVEAVPPSPPAARRPRKGPVAAVDRRRDVVLPRTAVISWSLFAILALGLSFVAGLMIGHYRWK